MALQAKFDDGVPSVQDQPDSTEPALDGRLAARYERMSEAGRGDGTGVTIRQAVESRSEPLSGIMSTVCTVPTETKRWGGGGQLSRLPQHEFIDTAYATLPLDVHAIPSESRTCFVLIRWAPRALHALPAAPKVANLPGR